MTTRNRMMLVAGIGAVAFAMIASPADADSRRHVSKPGDAGWRDAAAPRAPEIDPSSIGLGIALAAGGLALLRGRRRSGM